jgi:hypothetical protein
MANCHDIFTAFNKTIRLNDSKRKSLKKSRKSLRDKIRKYFDEKKPNEIKPKFNGQGSLLMDTIIEPIPREIEENGEKKKVYYYDVDDGVYFIGEKKDRKTIQTYHDWIKEAVDGHTSTPPVDKNTCVRVIFADGHNIDLPIYFKHDDIPELAHKAKDWLDSDPKAFVEWFEEKVKGKEQLRRLVRYLKACSDYRRFKRTDKKMPSGFILTILACNNYYSHDRDDVALKETLILIQAELQRKFQCLRPTAPKDENLLESYTQKDYFMECLQNLIDDAKSAIEEKNQKKACEKWQKHFGDRLPCNLAKDEEEKSSATKPLAAVAATSRPWSNRT